MSPSLAELRSHAGEFEAQIVDERAYLDVIDQAAKALDRGGMSFVFIGGLASSAYGRPRWTHDGDVLVKPDDAQRALEVLRSAGFKTEETDPHWLYKAIKDKTLIDVLFRSKGDVYLDDEMLARAREVEFKGITLRLIPPEDLIVLKAIVHEENLPHHWYDALGVIAGQELDWDYLIERATQRGGKRVLSLLVYAQSNDIAVPSRVISALHRAIFEA
jgi:predicted nucleotidyltransferase